MTKKPKSMARKHGTPRKTKYFNLEDSDISFFWVSKKHNGYYLYGVELGEVGGPAATICEALDCDPQFGGSNRFIIETNVRLEELFEILNSYAFESLMYNTSSLKINDVEIDKECLQRVLIWYKAMRETEKKYFIQRVFR
jgi:hypothetical protein